MKRTEFPEFPDRSVGRLCALPRASALNSDSSTYRGLESVKLTPVYFQTENFGNLNDLWLN